MYVCVSQCVTRGGATAWVGGYAGARIGDQMGRGRLGTQLRERVERRTRRQRGSQGGRGEPCSYMYERARRVRTQAGTRASTPFTALASKRSGLQAIVLAWATFSFV